jgi:uncharacterized protein
MEEDIQEKKKRSILEILVIHLLLLAFCWTGALVFGSFVSAGVLLHKKIPHNVSQLSDEELKTLPDKLVNEFKAEYTEENSKKVQHDYLEYIFLKKPIFMLWNNLVWVLCFIFPAYFLLKKRLQVDVNVFYSPFKYGLLFQGLNYGVLLFLLFGMVSMFFKLFGLEPSPIESQSILFRSIYQNVELLGWSIYSVGILTGVCEELFFRGFLLEHYIEDGYPMEGLFLTSIIFGFIHYTPESSILIPILLSFAGAFFGWLYIHTKNLWVPIFTHTVFNSSSLILSFFIEQKTL